MVLLSTPAWAHDCEPKLVDRPSEKKLVDMIVAQMQRRDIRFNELSSAIYELGAGLPVLEIPQSRQGADLIRTLIPVRLWKPVIDLVHWKGHHYSEMSRGPFLQPLLVNSFWGRPINLHAEDLVSVQLFQFPDQRTTRATLIVGPLDESREKQRELFAELLKWQPDLKIDFVSYSDDRRSFQVLALRGISDRIEGIRFVQRLLSELQDRRQLGVGPQ